VSHQTIEGDGQRAGSGPQPVINRVLAGLMWLFAAFMLVILVWAALQRAGVSFTSARGSSPEFPERSTLTAQTSAVLPEFNPAGAHGGVTRLASVYTTIPSRPRAGITYYEVEPGDSVMGIAIEYKIKPETLLWANYDLLQDNPNMLSVGQNLKIPAVDGVLYQWKGSDSIENIARKFKAKPDDILTWPSNNLDLLNPTIATGALVMVPYGSRELISWVVPTIWRANSGANKTINEACDTSGGSYYGTGTFGWPADNHRLSGNDFWSGHLGIDIAAATGAPVYATDSGVVVYASSISGGYGLMVMIDHGNGFHSLYAHLSQINIRCGQNAGKGQVIGYAGSTGNSTGPHLHFEIRYNGAFVNPWDYMR
jgi:murein DD-endopeptidase MepM/ murein hydrolase activator NlpD